MIKAAAATITLSVLAFAPGALAQTPPACDAPEHRAFDFWIGEWDAYVTGTENLAGRSSIKSEDSGCVITEHWTSVGQPYSGRSLNGFDRTTGHWHQYYMDSTGEVTRFTGNPIGGHGMQLTDTANLNARSPTTPVQTRMTFTPNADGSVRQHGEISLDNGATWLTRYDFTYRRRAG